MDRDRFDVVPDPNFHFDAGKSEFFPVTGTFTAMSFYINLSIFHHRHRLIGVIIFNDLDSIGKCSV